MSEERHRPCHHDVERLVDQLKAALELLDVRAHYHARLVERPEALQALLLLALQLNALLHGPAEPAWSLSEAWLFHVCEQRDWFLRKDAHGRLLLCARDAPGAVPDFARALFHAVEREDYKPLRWPTTATEPTP